MILEKDGCEKVESILDNEKIAFLQNVLGTMDRAGKRGLLSIPEIREVALSPEILDLIRARIGISAMPVRSIFFDKTPETNWGVAWHQDLTIALKSQEELEGYGPWSVKQGVIHVQPPMKVLEKMLTIRIHLDDCDDSNGALQVLPESHLEGRMSAERIQYWRENHPPVLCEMKQGDALLMRPLLLHSSGHSKSDKRRRVLHIEYSADLLPEPLEWYEKSDVSPTNSK